MGFEQVRRKLEAGERLVIVGYGDSWTYGSCADGWEEARAAGYDRELITGSWIVQLQRYCAVRSAHVEVHNAGQGGWTAARGAEQFDELVGRLEPDLVLLNFGINDWRHRVPLADYRRTMESLVERIRLLGSDCVLWTSGPVSSVRGETHEWDDPVDDREFPHPFAAYNETIRDIARERGLTLADAERAILADTEFVRSQGAWFLDAIHFLQPGHDRIFRCMRETLLV